MRLLDPVLGVPRVWAGGGEVASRDGVKSRRGRELERAVTTPRVDGSGMGMLMAPMTPERANAILAAALAGDLASQWDLFTLMEDRWDRLAKNLAEVKNAVKRLSWNVQAHTTGGEAGELAKEKAGLVERALASWEPEAESLEHGFEDFLWHGLDAMGKGISVQEVHWSFRDGEWLPRAAHLLTPRQYGWNGDGTRLGLIDGGGWRAFPAGQFAVGVWHGRSGAPGATALLRPLVPYYIGQTYGWKWLMQTAQLFGVPFRWATYEPGEAGVAERLGEMLANLGSAGWAAFPAGTTLEFKEAVTTARDNPQVVLLDMGRRACDLMILGQELSSTSEPTGLGSGSAALQGAVRQDVLHGAAWWVAELVNYQLIPALLRLNYGETSEAPVVSPDLSIDPDPKTLAERDAILGAMGLRLPDSWMRRRHSVPSIEEGELVVEPPTQAGLMPSSFLGARRAVEARAGEATERMIDGVLESLTGVEARWLGSVRPVFGKLLAMARDGAVSDQNLSAAIEESSRSMPELFARLDTGALAAALEAALGAAAVNGAMSGHLARGRRR